MPSNVAVQKKLIENDLIAKIMIFPNEIFCRLSNWNIVAHCPNNGRIEQRCNFPLIVHIFIALRTMPGHISKIPPNIRLWEQWRDINSLVLHNICTAAVAVNTLLTVDLYTITPPSRTPWEVIASQRPAIAINRSFSVRIYIGTNMFMLEPHNVIE